MKMAARDYPQSLYLECHRSEIPRQRSNSLPLGLALMNAEEAGMLFSAAERATARRRKIQSVDTPSWGNSPSSTRPTSPSPVISEAYKPSPLQQMTVAEPQIQPCRSEPASRIPQRAPWPLDAISTSNFTLTRSLTTDHPFLQSLPVSPLSPKRQVPSLSLKNYADGLFTFTQTRLSSTLPQITHPIASFTEKPPTPPPEEPVFSRGIFKGRPTLQSRFSDWSIATDSVPHSRRDSVAASPDEITSAGPVLLSPDSFFSAVEHTPTREELNRFSGITYASSETYDPPSVDPLPTPPERYGNDTTGPGNKEEISYFTNFDKYLDRDSMAGTSDVEIETQDDDSLEDIQTSQPDEVVIELSPFDLMQFPSPPSSSMRPRANTAIRETTRTTRSQSFAASQAPGSGFVPNSAPTTPYQTADVAIRVPKWLIGTIR